MHFFKNESESETIGNLTLDNRVDRVTVSGDVDLTLDKPGLALAETLLERLTGIVAAMHAAADKGALPDRIQIVEAVPAGNLFGLPDPKRS
jgi:hypothetical protein